MLFQLRPLLVPFQMTPSSPGGGDEEEEEEVEEEEVESES